MPKPSWVDRAGGLGYSRKIRGEQEEVTPINPEIISLFPEEEVELTDPLSTVAGMEESVQDLLYAPPSKEQQQTNKAFLREQREEFKESDFKAVDNLVNSLLKPPTRFPEEEKVEVDYGGQSLLSKLFRAETVGSRDDPWIRTQEMTAAGSSAFGPAQITKGLLQSILENPSIARNLTEEEREFARHMVDRQALALEFGINTTSMEKGMLPEELQAKTDFELQRFLEKHPDKTPQEFAELQYGKGLGIIRTEKDKTLYNSLAKKISNDQMAKARKQVTPELKRVFKNIARIFGTSYENVLAAQTWHNGLGAGFEDTKWLFSPSGRNYLMRMEKTL